jgi:RNA polymerase sigma-70 factor (ECF subfamily)
VLRLHALDGLSVASIGAMYRRDASTVSRWLDAIRRQLLAGTRAHLSEALSLSPSELDSLRRVASAPSVSL